jgi:hypothetical protein
MKQNVYQSSCKVPVILVRFQWTSKCLDRLSKNTQILNFMKIRPVGTIIVSCGRTDMTKLEVALRNFCDHGLKTYNKRMARLPHVLTTDPKFVTTRASRHFSIRYRVRQKYLTILQNSFEWNRWRGEFVLERFSSETQSISDAMERWSVEHRAFAVETYFKNNDSVLTQRIFRRHFNIHRNECP